MIEQHVAVTGRRSRLVITVSERAVVAAVLVVLVLLRAPFFLRPLETLDESLVLVYAQEVVDGRVPHRDFFTVYGPAGFWLVAGFFKLLGPDLVTERLVGLLLQALIAVGVYRMARARGRTAALLAVGVCILCMTPLQLAAYSWLGGLACIVWGIDLAGRRRAVLAGFALLGLTPLFRPEMLVPAVAAAIPLTVIVSARMQALAAMGLGLLPSAIFYATWGRSAVDNILLQRSSVDANPSASPMMVAVLVVAVAGTGLVVAAALRRRTADAWSRALPAACLLPMVIQRADIDHLAYAFALTGPLAVLAARDLLLDRQAPTRTSALVQCCAVLGVALLFAAPQLAQSGGVSVPYAVSDRDVRLNPDMAIAVDATRREVLRVSQPGDTVFIGTFDMSRPTVNAIQLYFLIPELRPSSYYLELFIGVLPGSAEAVARDIRRADVVVLSGASPSTGASEGGTDTESAAPNDAVREGFCPSGSSETFEVLVRCAASGVTSQDR